LLPLSFLQFEQFDGTHPFATMKGDVWVVVGLAHLEDAQYWMTYRQVSSPSLLANYCLLSVVILPDYVETFENLLKFFF
jgi:hypothetical protein